MNIQLKLGNVLDATYLVGITTAPRAYDGFGTIDLAPTYLGDREARLVLIRAEHAHWQACRYGSGIHSFETDDLPGVDESIIVEELYKRLTGSTE